MSPDRAHDPVHEPTAPVKPAVRGRGDTPPPLPPHELAREATADRTFTHRGDTWIARMAGKGAAGTGSYGLGLIEAIQFLRADAPAVPVREALLARGRFDALFDAELGDLLDRATPVPPPAT